ncbi:DUF255 domain-containing protein [Streptomyces sp. C184]|uniref:DUF255 domain-containing protein n=1 Tax=Streptomyces sp. C184 TaxID=3237121 RepID=UPI0034C6CF31
MPNRLAHETSPYLLQHADNPVDSWPWSADAFEEARRRGVPVLLSVEVYEGGHFYLNSHAAAVMEAISAGIAEPSLIGPPASDR